MADSIRIQTDFLAAVIASAVTLHLLLRYRRSRLHLRYAALAINLVAWYVADAVWASSGYGIEAVKVIRLLAAAALPVSAIRFFRAFTGDESAAGARLTRLTTVLSVAAGVLVVLNEPHIDRAVQGSLFAYVFASLFLSVHLLRQRMRRAESARERGRIHVLTVGGAATFSVALVDYMPHVGGYYAGNVLSAFYVYVLYEVLVRRRLLDLYELIVKLVATIAFSLLVGAIWIVLVVWWRWSAEAFLFNALLASFVVVILFEPLRSVVEPRVTALILRGRPSLASHLAPVGAALAGIVEPRELARALVRGLDASRRTTQVSVYLAEGNGDVLELAAWSGPEPARHLEPLADGPLVDELARGRTLVTEALEDEREAQQGPGDSTGARTDLEALERQIRSLHAIGGGVAVPMVATAKLVGCIAVRDDRMRDAFTSDDLRALESLAAQATLGFQATRAYERIRSRDRMAALGEMAAGLAHEIRNPLGAMKGAAQLLLDAPDGERDMLDVIVEEVDRLDGVVRRFLDYARPAPAALAILDVNEVVGRAVHVIRAQRGVHDVVFAPGDALPPVRGDADLLHQVLLNLGLNGLQAMASRGTLTVRTEVAPVANGGAPEGIDVCVRFTDTGVGLEAAVRERIFTPFYTTRPGGTGLGLPISDRIVRQLGGRIDVESRPGAGATFTVCLPSDGGSP